MPKVTPQRPIPISKSDPRTVNGQAVPGIVNRIAPIGFDEEEGLKMLVYGRSGTGKTTFWATFPKPILAIISSGGNQSGELRSIDTPEYRKTIHQVALQESEELEEILTWLRGQEGKYRTLVLDHASGFQDLLLQEILGLEEGTLLQKNWGLASREQYGQVTVRFRKHLHDLLRIQQHVVVVAQEREFSAEDNQELLAPYVGASLQPSIARWLNTAVDYVVQTFLREGAVEKKIKIGPNKFKTIQRKGGKVEFCLRTAPDPVYYAKFRTPRRSAREIPACIVDPSYEKIRSLIKPE
jgi:energy-coupling factor transporter ATP-binding protein EcfA2